VMTVDDFCSHLSDDVALFGRTQAAARRSGSKEIFYLVKSSSYFDFLSRLIDTRDERSRKP
jgi:hypothetical protein